jgi:Acetyltransferase (GNAT) domain
VIKKTTVSLFEEDYWLEAVAPGAWSTVEVKREDGELIGRLPYVVKHKHRLTAISTPWYTTWLTPWIKPSGGKPTSELSHQHQVLEQLIKGLPRAERTFVACAPEFTNLQAFHWAGFKLSYGYTHRLDTQNTEAIWTDMRDTVRRQIRKAEKQTVVTNSRSVKEFIGILEKTFGRQGIDVSRSFSDLERIDDAMFARKQREIWTTEDAQGNIHAAVYTVFDDRHTVYIAGGGDPEFRQSGGHSLAMWSAIQSAKNHSPIFDFAGSMVQNIEYFVRGFGAIQTPRFMAEKYQGLGKLSRAFTALRS